MQTKIYEINSAGINKIDGVSFHELLKNEDSLYLVDLQTEHRDLLSLALEPFNFPDEIVESLKTPDKHIRFEYLEDILYGELAYFSLKTKKPSYAGVINKKNVVITIHEIDEGLMPDLMKSIYSFGKEKLASLRVEYLMYIFVVEILSKYGNLILHYREEVEELALDFDNKHTEVSPADFLEAKSQLSKFSRVLEKLYFTLSFPPTRDFLDTKNPYRLYFSDLQKSLDLTKHSLNQTEERLNSLNDHYQLLLQDKSNKRLKFLTVIQAIFVPLTLIAGIYGMNFKYMPLIEFKYGYFISLGIMAISAVFFIWYFFKHGWFEK
jgi:magnesium transporter